MPQLNKPTRVRVRILFIPFSPKEEVVLAILAAFASHSIVGRMVI
jgi:hypothetical protein